MEKDYITILQSDYDALLINDDHLSLLIDALKEAATGAYNGTVFFDGTALSAAMKLLFPDTHKAIVARFEEGEK